MARPQRGFKLKTCPDCARKRHCVKHREMPEERYRWECSQGHIWFVPFTTADRLNELFVDVFELAIAKIFDSPSPLFGLFRVSR